MLVTESKFPSQKLVHGARRPSNYDETYRLLAQFHYLLLQDASVNRTPNSVLVNCSSNYDLVHCLYKLRLLIWCEIISSKASSLTDMQMNNSSGLLTTYAPKYEWVRQHTEASRSFLPQQEQKHATLISNMLYLNAFLISFRG
jgi:hypothetical protein